MVTTEKRRHVRFKSYNLIRLLDESGKVTKNKPTLVNVSEGGLCFYCDEPLPLNDRIQVRIQIKELKSSVTAFGRVIWTQRSTEHEGQHLSGVEFVDLDETDRDIIRRLERVSRRKE